MFWVTLLAVCAAVVLAVLLAEDRRMTRWRQISFEARLRETKTRGEVFERALARLRSDAQSGKLQVNDDYRPLFDRLTAEAKTSTPADE